MTKIVKVMKIMGLAGLISYTIVILFTWISANLQGYVYFFTGEPILVIKYLEWIIGIIGIFVAFDYLFKELKGI